jgi:hypothetical protein
MSDPKVWEAEEVLTAADLNPVAAQAAYALKPNGNLAGLTNVATARGNLGLAPVAASGDYDDLDNRLLIHQADGGLRVVDEYGFVAMDVATTGPIRLAEVEDLRVDNRINADNFGLAENTDDTSRFRIEDDSGHVLAEFSESGVTLPGIATTRTGSTIPTVDVDELTVAGAIDAAGATLAENDGAVGLKIVDEYGFTAGAIGIDGSGSGVFSAGTGGGGEDEDPAPTTYSVSEIQARNGIALAQAAGMATRLDHATQRLTFAYNHIVLYGQSLANGAEGVPELTLTAKYGNLMLGSEPHSASGNTTGVVTWTAATSNAFYDLTAAGYGETILNGALDTFRRLDFRTRGVTANTAQRLVGNEAGIGGKAIAELSKGASPEYYDRLTDLATLGKSVADGLSATYGIGALIWMQGESDQTTSRATYLAAMRALYADFIADVAVGICSQTEPPALFTYQTVARNVNYDGTDLGVQMAQLDMATQDAGVYMIGPIYNLPDSNNIHLPANSYRWFGAMTGKVMHRVLTLGHAWRPLYPIKATRRGAEILVDFHVPHPPLTTAAIWRSTTTGGTNSSTTFDDLGFTVVAEGSPVAVDTVEIVSDTQVLITTEAPLPDAFDVHVRYADSLHFGGGNLCDSDPAVSEEVYIYDPTTYTGQGDVDNIPELHDLPYPLQNWCVAFHMLTEIE